MLINESFKVIGRVEEYAILAKRGKKEAQGVMKFWIP